MLCAKMFMANARIKTLKMKILGHILQILEWAVLLVPATVVYAGSLIGYCILFFSAFLKPESLILNVILLLPGYSLYSAWWIYLKREEISFNQVRWWIWLGLLIGAFITVIVVLLVYQDTDRKFDDLMFLLVIFIGPPIIVTNSLRVLRLSGVINRDKLNHD